MNHRPCFVTILFAAVITTLYNMFWDQVISTATYIWDNQTKPWMMMTTTFLIGMIDNKYNDHDATTTAFVDPCHMTKYDSGFPSGFFAERFYHSGHAPRVPAGP
jgi:hypothetical protein